MKREGERVACLKTVGGGASDIEVALALLLFDKNSEFASLGGMQSSSVPPVLSDHPNGTLPRANPWGAWSTAGLGFGLLIVTFIVQNICAVAYAMIEMIVLHHELKAEEIETNGLLIAIATMIDAPVVVATVCVFVKMRRGWSVVDYLALKPCRLKSLLFWCAVALAYNVLEGVVGRLLGIPTPNFMIEAYESARAMHVLPLLWLALIVAAPIGEEFIMRGFLFKGWLHSPLKGIGTILLTSIIWALIHLQYDLYVMTTIFGVGLVLGLARWKTGSIVPCIIIHGLNNLIPTIYLHFSPP